MYILYLLGSIDLAPEGLYPLDDVITDAYKSSDYLVVEIDIRRPDISTVMKRAYYQDTNTLAGNLKPETYKKLTDEFLKFKITEPFYQKMKPWFAVMTLQSLDMMKKGNTSENGIDMHFLQSATNDSLPVLELESSGFQMNLLDSILQQMQDDFVLFSLSDFDTTGSDVDSMYEYWKTGNADELEKVAFREFEIMPNAAEFEKAFVTDRNINMANKIREYLNGDKTYFVVVGAAHLVGKNGIVNLLKNDGIYKINQK